MIQASRLTSTNLLWLSGEVISMTIDTEEGLALILILGVPDDGTPVQIRTGFMSYNKNVKTLFFAQRKRDLPHFAKILK
jgi:hypothetical protein